MWRTRSTLAALTLATIALIGTAQRSVELPRATGQIAATVWPYFPGSIIPVRVDGFPVPYHVALVGPGTLLDGGLYEVPQNALPGTATIIAGNADGLAERNLRIGAPPYAQRALLAVVSYDDGIVFHDAQTYAVLGLLATGGAPSDAAFDSGGRIAATDTQGTSMTVATLAPWNVKRVPGVPFGDEVEIDRSTGDIFVTDRDVDGAGALTRIDPSGTTARVITGETAEGLAIDERRHIVYVANVNDGTVAAIDTRSLRLLRRFPAIDRVFSLALSSDGGVLYAISNQSAGSPFAAPGAAVAIALRGKKPHIIARSGDLTFPIGTVLDGPTHTLFVTDESLDVVDVLDARTLRATRAPLATCHTPWKPMLDEVTQRLYVPCARADRVDAFDARTLRRIPGAPFITGGYPLAVTVWHPPSAANKSFP